MAALKKALFYTLVRNWGTEYKVMAVTTEKSRQYFGRYTGDDSATHVRISDTIGRFDTEVKAHDRIEAVKATRKAHADTIRRAREALDAAYAAEERDIKIALRIP